MSKSYFAYDNKENPKMPYCDRHEDEGCWYHGERAHHSICGQSPISAPWYRSECTENFSFFLYTQDCDRKAQIDKVIKLMVAAGPERCNDFATQCMIYDEVGIDSNTFTDQEVQYIESEVARWISI